MISISSQPRSHRCNAANLRSGLILWLTMKKYASLSVRWKGLEVVYIEPQIEGKSKLAPDWFSRLGIRVKKKAAVSLFLGTAVICTFYIHNNVNTILHWEI